MPSSVAHSESARHRLLSDMAPTMAKAHIRKADTPDEWRVRMGLAVRRCRALSGLTLKEFADAIGRDERQVSRWENGVERPHGDAMLGVPLLRGFWIQAQGEVAGDSVEIETVVRIMRRTA